MKFSKVRDVKSPVRGHERDAGIDFFVPNDGDTYCISSGNSVLIPSGIKVNVPKGFALIAFNKSGIAVKKNLYAGACVVDEDYQGEIHLHLTNVGYEDVWLSPGDKVLQFLLIPIFYSKPEEVEFKDLYKEETDRGEGGFGSTNG